MFDQIFFLKCIFFPVKKKKSETVEEETGGNVWRWRIFQGEASNSPLM